MWLRLDHDGERLLHGKDRSLQQNPVTKVKIVPRTMCEDQMGITWTSEAGAPLCEL
jgi:hypothetical protein